MVIIHFFGILGFFGFVGILYDCVMALRRPRRISRKFSRKVSPAMRAFAERRHRRHGGRSRQRMSKWARRSTAMLPAAWAWFRRWWLAMVLGVAAAGIAVVFLSPLLRVRGIRIQRAQGRVDVVAVQKELAPFLGQHLLFVASHDIVESVRRVVPDLESVDVQKQYPSLLYLRIALKPVIARLNFEEPGGNQPPPVAATAGSGAVAVADVHKFDYLTENGVYVAAGIAQSGAILPTLRIVDWGVRPVPGEQLLSADFLEHMRLIELALQGEFGLRITGRTVYLRASEFHFSIGKISLWFDTQGTVEDQLKRYRTFLRTVGMNNVGQYVDLRLSGRVVYR